jgi:hypothetical protein
VKRCEEHHQARMQRREEGDREAKRAPDEGPSLGLLVGRVLDFESPRHDGQGGKQSLNTTVISGRSIAEDPWSLIVFYRSHLGGCGNLLESILHSRSPSARAVTHRDAHDVQPGLAVHAHHLVSLVLVPGGAQPLPQSPTVAAARRRVQGEPWPGDLELAAPSGDTGIEAAVTCGKCASPSSGCGWWCC